MADIERIVVDNRMLKQLNMFCENASEFGSGHGNEIYLPSNFVREMFSK